MPTIKVVPVFPHRDYVQQRWSFLVNGRFPSDLYDLKWGLLTFPSEAEAEQAAHEYLRRQAAREERRSDEGGSETLPA